MELAELARWIELADAEGMAGAVLAAMGRGEPGEVEEIGGARMMWAGPRSPFNVVAGLGFDGEVSAETLARIKAFYAGRGEAARFHLSPLAHPSLIQRAGEAGFVLKSFTDVLTRPLSAGEDLSPRNDELELRPVDPSDPQQVLQAAQVLARGFANGAEPPEEELRLEQMILRQPDAMALLAWRDGVPVGGGLLGWGRERVVLIAGATLPEHRKSGVQTALMRERLRRGQQMGARMAQVGANPGVATRRNAERLGFSHVYTRVLLSSQ